LAVLVLLCVPPAVVVIDTVSDWLTLISLDVEVEVDEAVVVALPRIEFPVPRVVLVAVWVVVAVTACVWLVEVWLAVEVDTAVVVVV
jgi:hypothetical protein